MATHTNKKKYGFNPSRVTIAQNGVQSAYNLIMTELNTNFQSKFIDIIAISWACPVAQKYFETVSLQINEIINLTTTNFKILQQTIKNAGESWAFSQEYNYYGKILEPQISTIDITGIKDIINGVVGIINEESIDEALNSLSIIQLKIEEYLEQVKKIISNNEIFLGGGQQSYLYSLINKISNTIIEGFGTIKYGINQEIEQTKIEYQTTSTNIANTFTI